MLEILGIFIFLIIFFLNCINKSSKIDDINKEDNGCIMPRKSKVLY